ncbi:MAG: PfkB family carbohydrate kinase [Streptosporangiaceae bacterium]|jgi:fructokinase
MVHPSCSARACAPAFLGRLSQDGFGRMLRARLEQDGVAIGLPQLTDAPTTLAAVDVDPGGVPRYHFYLDGTSSAALEYPIALSADLTALHAGTLALVTEPAATSIERLITRDLPPDALVMVDPNCRPQAIADRPAYLARLARTLDRADVVKVSAEDLAYLSRRADPRRRRGPAQAGVRARPARRWSSRRAGFAARAEDSRRCPGGEGRGHHRRRRRVRRGVPGLVDR